ncbi:calcium binding EGF domain protein [Teladorsagia circumcincta]|uniref:Calcium binding EGF domain protein n=1 Tax=Teladorsagia circumcincta TaxID=45464 RepID=A0A2G9TZ20_TELCI|nr:calcium binding EGF domain protein [Teladorsagia circumcincta]
MGKSGAISKEMKRNIRALETETQFSDLKLRVEAISARQDTFKSRIESHQSTLILVATASRQILQSVANTTKKVNELQEWRQNKTVKDGENCEEDIDECAIYEGTHAGCQNNATCENHDTGFRCICDWGYKVSDDKLNPTCVDVDECLDNPCHPGVDCINLPGKFQCTGCPKGYHGNGQICADIDECAAEIYPCSTIPHVPCFNTIGSFHCGDCPAGYHGDGRSCTKRSACDGAPCHPTATCVDDQTSLNPGGYTCLCPAGCGAHFAESVGNLTFPDNGEMPPEQQCDFVISTGEENSVRLYRESSSKCGFNGQS